MTFSNTNNSIYNLQTNHRGTLVTPASIPNEAPALPLDGVARPFCALGLTRLSSEYFGNLIRVISTANEERDIGFVNETTLDVQTLLSFARGGNLEVVTWYDQSGFGNNFQTNTAATRPKIVTNGRLEVFAETGMPCLDFHPIRGMRLLGYALPIRQATAVIGNETPLFRGFHTILGNANEAGGLRFGNIIADETDRYETGQTYTPKFVWINNVSRDPNSNSLFFPAQRSKVVTARNDQSTDTPIIGNYLGTDQGGGTLRQAVTIGWNANTTEASRALVDNRLMKLYRVLL
jgi:hypothetical protein